ncbi:ExbD/TolR family protein [Tropicimonas marinistellae]|uniref:ExbD/TolR family protein n=1 Tax=Tropicimonas marinistellae TaxID=1739787 RepID=UPI000833198C|nr:biopolymer transporter ExbD [Tropicimonas marinistellae]
MESLRPIRARRRPSLTPMVDVVFLLLVFFMLASRFGTDRSLPLPLAGAGEGYSGPPRLLEVAPDALFLNGVPTAVEDMPGRLESLTETRADTIILQGRDGTTLQRVVDVTQILNAAGFATLVLIE